jgi:hypothetical protein
VRNTVNLYRPAFLDRELLGRPVELLDGPVMR